VYAAADFDTSGIRTLVLKIRWLLKVILLIKGYTILYIRNLYKSEDIKKAFHIRNIKGFKTREEDGARTHDP
jgi:hypothetical protein